MRISVQVHGSLQATSTVGPSKKDYSARTDASVRDLLGEFNICESEVRKVMRNGQLIRLDTRLRSRDHLEVY